ncbi:MAG: DUF1289 domain-containing protein [Alphaproteobacteria bacterium]
MRTPVQTVSPCISVCQMNMRTGQCKGCYRTLEEIGAWRVADPARQREILLTIAQRMRDDLKPDRHERKVRLSARLRAAGVID